MENNKGYDEYSLSTQHGCVCKYNLLINVTNTSFTLYRKHSFFKMFIIDEHLLSPANREGVGHVGPRPT